MSTGWRLTMKPSFLNAWLGLPPKESQQVLKKIQMLTEDPTPDAKVKKQLKHHSARIYRLRSGDYRIFYTYDEPYVSLLALRKRDERTFKDEVEEEHLGGLDSELKTETTAPHWQTILDIKKKSQTPLPEKLTSELLERLKVPTSLHSILSKSKTREELFDCAGVPDEIILRVDEYLFEKPIEEVLQQPDYIAGDVSDLLKFKEGDLLGFLLRLDPEQEKYVDWALNAQGPTLLKGGPGTGKSTIAIYRTRAFLRTLSKETKPRILFTTYTNALVQFSRQLLQQLLGEDASLIDVRTADSLVHQIKNPKADKRSFAESKDLKAILREAIQKAPFQGKAVEIVGQKRVVERLTLEYLLEEITSVIQARGLKSIDEYLNASRPGRKLPLNETNRKAVWTVYETFREIMNSRGKVYWEQLRSEAEQHVASGDYKIKYDAVIVDEVQDLNPCVLRLLLRLCKAPNRLFVTADANQAIYGSGFRWTDVHEDLKFKGRTGVLYANYRNTQEVQDAANDYLSNGAMEDLESKIRFAHYGPLPAVRTIRNSTEEAELLYSFLSAAPREFRLSTGSCAVLVPTEEVGRSLAGRLFDKGLNAEFMSGKDLDLKKNAVKVITLRSAKGLEFPIVAIAGFVSTKYPILPDGAPDEVLQELIAKERRVLYVGMTRAMRALLILSPSGTDNPLLNNFNEKLWNIGKRQ